MKFSSDEIKYLLTPVAIRERCSELYGKALSGKTNFVIHEGRLASAAKYVMEVMNQNYPDGNIPFHSRWGHFNVGGIDRLSPVRKALQVFDSKERARRLLDLVIVSVLLDAGAGAQWKYLDRDSGQTSERSEGLAVASLRMFEAGLFSSIAGDPLRVDGEVLKELSAQDFARGMQVGDENPLEGLDGRHLLLQKLGNLLVARSEVFAQKRPGNILDYMLDEAQGEPLTATMILSAVIKVFGHIWPGRIELGGVNLGDVWPHGLMGSVESTTSLIPFHKLSQWLSYSMIEPIVEAQIAVTGVEKLTGLAEYRNGGFFLDFGVLELRSPDLASKNHRPNDEIIVEWRALTIVLLDKIADLIRAEMKKTEIDLPLVKVLEGGTWWAGRRLAQEKRPKATPPLNIISDGTVF